MRRNLHFLEYLFCHLLLIFLLGRVGFMLYNNSIEDFGPGDVFSACKNGLLAHDALLSSVLLAMPWLVSLLALHWPKLPLRALLSPYYLVIGIVVGVLIVADAVMYEFWQFKLGYVVLSYASSPEGTTNSVSIGFLLIDFPLAIGFGLFVGLLNLVPYLQLVAFIPTILLALLKAADTGQNFWWIMCCALLVFCIVQLIQDLIIVPKVMGKITGLNPAIILLSLSIWGSLMGIVGMIIALPCTSIMLSYYKRFILKQGKEN